MYVQLFVAKVRMTYPHKSKRQLRFELRNKVEKERDLLRRIEPLEREVEEIRAALENEENNGNARRRRANRDPEVP
jgi:hypothetical protein